jgi:L-phenylalanine/L-methionine N-acetyltransferase
MSTIKIRRAVAADAEALYQTFADPSVFGGTLQLPYPSLETWKERASANNANVLLLAEVDGEVVGNAGLHPEAARRRIHAAHIGMSVSRAWQRKGIGTALLVAVIDLAEKWMAITRLELTVFADNEAAIALYRKHGFEQEGLFRNFALRDGAYVDALTMARLRPAPSSTESPAKAPN